jgi:hypothetical protein
VVFLWCSGFFVSYAQFHISPLCPVPHLSVVLSFFILTLTLDPSLHYSIHFLLHSTFYNPPLLQWAQFWSLKKPYLSEKSPQSLLKAPFYRHVFAASKTVKFLIIIKHPATLNTATPKGFGWKYVIDLPSKDKRSTYKKQVAKR